jgi:hypothetical protein
MAIRHATLLMCTFLTAGFSQDSARLLVEGIGANGPTFAASAADLALLPQHTISVTDHGASVSFQGVLLADILAKVPTPTGERYHKTAASHYLVAEGRDGYRAVFSWAELDPSFLDKAVYVAAKRDGKPLPESEGPFELIVPGEKRNARWVRQLRLLRIEPNASPFDSDQARWIGANLPELESIKAGMTRRDLLNVFMEEGGLSTRAWRRYVYRKCAFVKVDVEFAPVGGPGNAEGPDDRITKISKPFLELTITD